MKKIVSLCVFITTALSFLLIINFYQTQDISDTLAMGQTSDSIDFYINGSKIDGQTEIDFFKYLSKKYHADFVLTSNDKVVYKSVLTYNNVHLAESFRLNKLSFHSNKDFYASYSTANPHQIGIIPVFYSKNKVVVQPLERYFNKTKNVGGMYTVSNYTSKEKLLAELSAFYQIPVKSLLTPSQGYKVSYFNKELIIIVIALLVTVLIFILVNIYLPMSNISNIGIEKLNGWSNSSIFWDLIKPGFYTIVISSIVLDLSLFWLFSYRPAHLLITELLIQLIIIILYLLANIFAFLLIRKMSISDLLHNRYHFNFGVVAAFMLKMIISLLTIFLLFNLSSSYQKLNKQYAIQQTWRKEGKLLILNSVQSGTNNNQIFNSWYKEMRRNNGVYYINSNIIDTATIMNTSHNKKIHDNQTIKLMTVNRNFIHDYLPELDTIAKNDFLVPNKLNTQYMAKVLRKKRYDDLSSTQQKKFYKTEKAISIKSYSQELNLISYNPTLQRSFVNPIIEIVDDNHLNEMQQLMLANTDVNSVLKIVGNQANRQKIAQLNKDPRYKPLGLKFAQLQSVLANVAADFSQQFRIFFEIIALTTVISIFTTLFLSLCIIYDRQKELAIKRLLGYRRIDSYKYEFAFLLVLASIETITLLILHVAPFALLLALSLACLDIIIFYLLVGYLEKKNLVQLLKGGSL